MSSLCVGMERSAVRGGTARFHVLAALVALAMTLTVVVMSPAAAGAVEGVTELSADDFTYGTYVIDKPGTYVLTEDIEFNPNSPATLDAAIAGGELPAGLAAAMGLSVPVDAYSAGFPLFTQFLPGGTDDFSPGGPLDAAYDPAAYGVGFFAAIAITADDVVLDLNGHTIEQSAEHALLQRFFAVIELADQPFVPGQGPAGFGDGIDSARNVTITNGTIGRSSHHGIHGNGNENVTISDVDFRGYEVGAVALNGVNGLTVTDVTAVNRKDVPVMGTYSSAQFIKQYVNELAHVGSTTTLEVDGDVLDVNDIRDALVAGINNTHHDLVVSPNVVDGRPQIDSAAHPDEYALFHNQHGVVDGNSYSFLVNPLGVAVNGFPLTPDGVTKIPSQNIVFRNVRVDDQRAFINEVPAISVDGVAAIDPVGAVFQTQNRHPDSGAPVTISSTDAAAAAYTGNAVANAQAFVAKAKHNGEFDSSFLDTTRLNIPASVLEWVEGASGSESLEAAGITYVCNGDSMFHVNKGVIAYKMDGANNVRMTNTTVRGLANLGVAGSTLCGDYLDGKSHPAATLPGYGGAVARGYTFAGSHNVVVSGGSVQGVRSFAGSAFGYDILTDSGNVRLINTAVRGLDAGWGGPAPDGSPTKAAKAYGYYVGPDVSRGAIVRGCMTNAVGLYGSVTIDDASGSARILGTCNAR